LASERAFRLAFSLGIGNKGLSAVSPSDYSTRVV